MSIFDFLNSINDTKVDLMVDDLSEREYNAYMVNRGLSYFPDTIFYANEMNVQRHLSGRMQYQFLLNSVRKKKRFSKWFKPSVVDAIVIIQEVYGFSTDKAKSAAMILTEDQIDQLRARVNQGGQKR